MQTWWQNEKAWAQNHILSSAKTSMYVMWGFTIFWNLISFAFFLAEKSIFSEFENNPSVAFFFLFPVIGVFLVFTTVSSTLNWKKYGSAPLTLDPFPGSIGGHVGGTIATRVPFNEGTEFEVTLSCQKSYISGSGKNRSRKEKALWQNEGYCHTSPSLDGTSLTFRFDVPTDQPESEPRDQETYIFWKLHVRIVAGDKKSKRKHFDRSYIIPVFKTNTESSDISISTSDHPHTQQSSEDGIYEIARITSLPEGIEAYFPAWQRPGVGIAMLAFGAFFTGSGLLIYKADAPVWFSFIFALIGAIIFLAGVFYLAKSLRVRVSPSGIATRRFLLGYPITSRTIEQAKLQKIEIKSNGSMQAGNKTTLLYNIVAHCRDNQRITVAERIQKRSEAERLKEMFELYLSLSS